MSQLGASHSHGHCAVQQCESSLRKSAAKGFRSTSHHFSVLLSRFGTSRSVKLLKRVALCATKPWPLKSRWDTHRILALRSLQVMEFRLSERFTFLEYLPVTRIRRCKSAPDLAGLIALGAPTLRLSLSGMRFGTRARRLGSAVLSLFRSERARFPVRTEALKPS